TVDGATAADATRSPGSPQKGEYASRYRATSSSDVKTQSAPTAARNSSRAALKSASLTPGGLAMVEFSSDSGRFARGDDPGTERRRLSEAREATVGRTEVARRGPRSGDQGVGEDARP